LFVRQAGFERPILHGLSTYGMAGRALLSAGCGHQSDQVRAISARFSSPLLPGQRLTRTSGRPDWSGFSRDR
jgi:acyl dehydratase